MASTVSAAFASDNAAGAHPRVIEAIVRANQGSVSSYGADPSTERAARKLRETFAAPDADVLFALTGTAANIIALSAAVRPWDEILCSDIAHSLMDEAGGPVRISGASLVPLPSDDGIIDPKLLTRRITRRGEVHHSQPRIVSITQSTENGRVWQPMPWPHSSSTPTVWICWSTSTAPGSPMPLPPWVLHRQKRSLTPMSCPSVAPRSA